MRPARGSPARNGRFVPLIVLMLPILTVMAGSYMAITVAGRDKGMSLDTLPGRLGIFSAPDGPATPRDLKPNAASPRPFPAGEFASPPVPSRFGVWLGTGTSDRVDLLKGSGSSWTQVRLEWSKVEPTYTNPPTYDFSRYDDFFATLNSAGIAPIAEIRSNPTWAATTVCGPIDKPGGPAAFARFLRAVVSRYSQPPYNVKNWEFYNEADNVEMGWLGKYLGGCFGNHPGQYASLLQVAYGAVKQTDPTAMVLNGGLAYEFDDPSFNIYFLDQILAAGAGNYIDVLNIHYYSSMAPHWSAYGVDIIGKVQSVRQTMANRGISKPVAVTETSWTDSRADSPDIPDGQARYIPKLLARSVALDLYVLLWFSLYDWNGADFPYGLADSSMQPKPSYAAYRLAVSELGQAASMRKLLPGELGVAEQVVDGYAYQVGDSERWLLWSNSGTVQIGLPARTAEAKDKMGIPILLNGHGAPTVIDLDSSPIYVYLNPPAVRVWVPIVWQSP